MQDAAWGSRFLPPAVNVAVAVTVTDVVIVRVKAPRIEDVVVTVEVLVSVEVDVTTDAGAIMLFDEAQRWTVVRGHQSAYVLVAVVAAPTAVEVIVLVVVGT